MRTVASCALVGLLTLAAAHAPAQPPAGGAAPPPPDQLFRSFRETFADGNLDVAAAYLKAFLDANPPPDLLLKLEERYGSTLFQKLRNVPKWSDNPAAQKQAVETVEELIKRSREANLKVLRDPARLTRYAMNLGKTYEERIFAVGELRRAGDFAVPYVVEVLTTLPDDAALQSGVIRLVVDSDQQSVAAWVAALDGLPPEQQYAVLSGIVRRRDAASLPNTAQTNVLPRLWHLTSLPADQFPNARKAVAGWLLALLGPGAERRDPTAELIAAGRQFFDHKARFLTPTPNPNGNPTTADLWRWDAAAKKLVKKTDVPVNQLEEYYGLKYARWALERTPTSEAAQQLVIGLATERAVERGKFGDLSKTDPAVYQLLSDAPTAALVDLLEQAIHGKRTALVLGLTQSLADRAAKEVALPRPAAPNRPPLLVRLLEYPDPRVQFAAATGLLRAPVPIDATVRGRVLEILKRAAGSDLGLPPTAKGQALVTDPIRVRADSTAAVLKTLGYETEVYDTGRDLLRRVKHASDFDLIVVDRHVVFPQLVDVLTQLRADVNAARRPVLVVASADKPSFPSPRAMLLRFAILIAVTEPDPVQIPPPEVVDLQRNRPAADIQKERDTNRVQRDGGFRSSAARRIARMNEVLDALRLQITPAQREQLNLRTEQFTYAILTAENTVSPLNAPETIDHINQLNRLIAAQPPVPPVTDRSGINDFAVRVERLELEVMRVPGLRQRYEALRRSIDLPAVGLAEESTRDRPTEERLARELRGFANVAIVPEPYSPVGFEDDLRVAFADPSQAPRDPAEKRAVTRAAVEWLARLAAGEVKGFDVRPAEAELRAALRADDLAEPAIDAVATIPTASAQQDLLSVALAATRPPAIRAKAADAVIRHVRAYTKLIPQTLTDSLIAQVAMEQNADVRGKLMVLRGMLAFTDGGFRDQLMTLPPAVDAPPPPPAKEPEKKEPEKKEPEKN